MFSRACASVPRVWNATPIRTGLSQIINPRAFANITASDLRQGMIFLHDDKYCEVKDYRPVKQGRGAASANITYIELPNGRQKETSKAATGKVVQIELEKYQYQLMYVDETEIVVADADFNEIRISLDFVNKDFIPALKTAENVRVTAFKDKETVVKLGFPPEITVSARKK